VTSTAVSVVIPAYEAEAYIGDALESVFAQTLRPLEIIVVDDGSTDSTSEIAGGFDEVKVIRQANSGPAAARNAGFAVATGDLVTFHDSDDLMPPRKLEIQAGFLSEHPSCGCVIGRQRVITEEGSPVPFWARGVPPLGNELGDNPASQERKGMIHMMTMLVRREAFERVGPFDVQMRMAEDIDWLFRAQELEIGVEVIDDVVLIRRIHGDNMTHDEEQAGRMLFVAFKQRMDRRRAAG
jgi:glycosyltransferase involved in cell wall biosynthesis